MTEYERGFSDGAQAAWDAVDQWIHRGHLPGGWAQHQRNGMVLAANEIMKIIDRLHGERSTNQ